LPAPSIRQRALAGETIAGAMIFEFFVPGIPQILRECRRAIRHLRHGAWRLGFETLKMLAAASRGTGVAPMVRVPRGEYPFHRPRARCRAQGVMVPMVESVEAAREIARAARYPMQGRRGAAFGFAHDN
jgi:2-dehydro-3-deoxyglucarate aldolase/4-hydroxy-2-oxoheptanedioate aldolase